MSSVNENSILDSRVDVEQHTIEITLIPNVFGLWTLDEDVISISLVLLLLA